MFVKHDSFERLNSDDSLEVDLTKYNFYREAGKLMNPYKKQLYEKPSRKPG